MERFSPTRGSPSEQLAAFNPIGYEGFSNRANPVPLPGMETVRPTGDPFAGWSNETGSARAPPSQTTTTTSGSCYAYPVPSAFDQANTQYQCSSVSPQLTRTINAAHYSIGQSQFPLVSAQVSPTSAGPGGMRYSPSHAQASQSLPRMQYSPHFSTHTQAHLGASQHPLSPVQTAIANARYSPSREDFSYEYRPTPEFISSLFATTRDLAVGNITASNNALAHASPDNQACRITGTTKLSSRSLPGGTHEVTEKHRSLIVHNVSLDATHRSIVMMFPIDEYPSLEDVCLKKFEAEGMFSFSFGDLREAIHAMKKIRLTRPTWRVFPASGEEIANFKGTNRVKGAALSSSVPQDGAFLLSVYAIPSQWLMEPMDDVVQHVAASLGTLRSCKLIENGTNMSRYQVEYFNKRHATYAFSCLESSL